MSSPADVTIKNLTNRSITTKVTRNSWVQGDGSAIDGKTIAANSQQTYKVTAKTGHHGELDIDLEESGTSTVLATLKIKSIKDPQDGSEFTGESDIADIQISAIGYRSSPGNEDLRRIDVTILELDSNKLRYNEISTKASHNSYQRDETIIKQLTWNWQNNYNCGCGALELDISQSDDGLNWSVGHKDSYDKDYRQLSGFLSDLTAWSNNNPRHDVITLHLDLKHTATANFPDKLDAYVKERLLVGIYTPGELMGTQETLSKGALVNGWPTLRELKGKFIVCVTGNEKDKGTYARTGARQRLCFADKDTDVDETPSDDNRVFFNFHIYHSNRSKWMATFKACADKPNVIVRAYEADSEDNWNDCIDSGCNLIATNKISNHRWAKVGAQRFAKLAPLV